jgi:hypothetical protein
MTGGVKKGTKLPHLTGKNACHWTGGKIQKKCLTCNKNFYVFPYRKNASFCSVSCLAKSFVGSKAKNWKGGKSPLDKKIRETKQYNEWRKSVYTRDNWTCQECFVKQKHPVAHHIKTFKDYPELRFDVSNGKTMCRSCHKKIHKEIGLKTQFSRVFIPIVEF